MTGTDNSRDKILKTNTHTHIGSHVALSDNRNTNYA